MNKNLANNQEEIDCNKYKLAYRKEVERAKKIFLNKKFVIIFVLIFATSLFLANKYKQETSDVVIYEDIAESEIVLVDEKNDEETEAEKNEKRKIVAEAIGNHQITFTGNDLKLKDFSSPEDGILLARYSSDILSSDPEHEIFIYQYKDEDPKSISELFEKESLFQSTTYPDPNYFKVKQYDDRYVIITSDFNDDSSSTILSLIAIIGNNESVYKITYSKDIKEDVLNNDKDWVDGDYDSLLFEFNNIDLSYIDRVFKDSLEIKNKLAENKDRKSVV